METIEFDTGNHPDGSSCDKKIETSNGEQSSSHTDGDAGGSSGIKFEDWEFQIDRLFDVAYRFYKRNESKAFHPSFEDRNQLIALILQARYGNFDGGRAPDVGALDLVGRSRRQHWATLKGMSKTEAMSKFIFTLNEQCPFFKAHVEAVKISCDVQTIVDGPRMADKQISGPATITTTSTKKDEKLEAIYTSLCRQTYQQFKGYAIKQYPNDVQQQKYLISSLQEQYYQQYISQMHPELKNISPREQLKRSPSPAASETSSVVMLENNEDNISTSSTKTDQDLAASNNSTTNKSNTIDQSKNNPKPIEIQTIINTGGRDNSPVSIVGDRRNIKNPSLETTSPQINSEPALNGLNTRPANQAAEQQRNYQARSKIHASKQEPCFPKPNPYQPIDLQSIGKFESFPKPKPIPNNARPVGTSNEVQIPATSQRPAYTAIELGEEPPTKEESSRSSLPSVLPPQELPPPPLQELPPPPNIDNGSLTAFVPPIVDIQQLRSETSPSEDPNNQLTISHESCPSVIPVDKLEPVELWGCNKSNSSSGEDSPLEQSVPYEPIEPATTWTKRGVNEFKESLVDDKHGGVYVVKQGTLVTIQVPTYPGGRYIYWEFVTEDYDIGFGLDFVYEANLMKPLAIKISEETDEDCDDDCDDEFEGRISNQTSGNIEEAIPEGEDRALSCLKQKRAEKFARLAKTVLVLPTYRRDSHEEIFVGRHKYPGRGYYLLQFDNTYSVLRSKTVFFRICYFI